MPSLELNNCHSKHKLCNYYSNKIIFLHLRILTNRNIFKLTYIYYFLTKLKITKMMTIIVQFTLYLNYLKTFNFTNIIFLYIQYDIINDIKIPISVFSCKQRYDIYQESFLQFPRQPSSESRVKRS